MGSAADRFRFVRAPVHCRRDLTAAEKSGRDSSAGILARLGLLGVTPGDTRHVEPEELLAAEVFVRDVQRSKVFYQQLGSNQ